jgi:hypothetical protein
MSARTAAVVGVALALVVAGIAIEKRKRPVEVRAVETTTAIRIVRRDAMGLPEKKGTVRDPAHVRTLTEALGIDIHPGAPCPPDYADADIGIVLSGNDIYAKRNVYVFGLLGDAAAPSVVSVTSAGCRAGPPADVASVKRELRAARIID